MRDATWRSLACWRMVAAGKGGCGVGRGRLVTERRRAAGVRRGAAARIITSRRRGARGPPRCSAAMHRRAPRALMNNARSKENGAPRQHAKVPIFRQAARWRVPRMGPVRTRYAPFSCPDDRLPWHFVRTTHRSVPRHRIARSGLAIESNRLCDVDRNRSDGAGGLRKFRVRPNPKCLVKTQPASQRQGSLIS